MANKLSKEQLLKRAAYAKAIAYVVCLLITASALIDLFPLAAGLFAPLMAPWLGYLFAAALIGISLLAAHWLLTKAFNSLERRLYKAILKPAIAAVPVVGPKQPLASLSPQQRLTDLKSELLSQKCTEFAQQLNSNGTSVDEGDIWSIAPLQTQVIHGALGRLSEEAKNKIPKQAFKDSNPLQTRWDQALDTLKKAVEWANKPKNSEITIVDEDTSIPTLSLSDQQCQEILSKLTALENFCDTQLCCAITHCFPRKPVYIANSSNRQRFERSMLEGLLINGKGAHPITGERFEQKDITSDNMLWWRLQTILVSNVQTLVENLKDLTPPQIVRDLDSLLNEAKIIAAGQENRNALVPAAAPSLPVTSPALTPSSTP